MQLRLPVRLAHFQKLGQLFAIVVACFFNTGVARSRSVTTADMKVQGKISDPKGDALVGVNVVAKGQKDFVFSMVSCYFWL